MKHFTFERRSYCVSQRAYDDGVIVLPDGRILIVRQWSKVDPRRPDDLILIGTTLRDASAAACAV